jgi:tetratricopeptide (TPR) repeat protein
VTLAAAGGLAALLSTFVSFLDRPRRDFVAWRYVQSARQKLTSHPVRRLSADHDLKRALALGSADPLMMAEVGQLLVACEDWAAAMDAMKRTQIKSLNQRISLGQCLLKTGSRDEGVTQILMAAAAAQSEYRTRLSALGDGPADKQQRAGAADAYAVIANDAGYTLVDAEVYIEAGANLIAAAVALAPLQPAFCDSLGWALHKQHRNDRALFYLERAVRQQLPNPDATMLYHLGVVYSLADRPADAQHMLTWCLREDPGNAAAADALRQLHRVLPPPAFVLGRAVAPS